MIDCNHPPVHLRTDPEDARHRSAPPKLLPVWQLVGVGVSVAAMVRLGTLDSPPRTRARVQWAMPADEPQFGQLSEHAHPPQLAESEDRLRVQAS